MGNSNLKNIVILKNLPSNFIEEAFVILKSNKHAKKLEKVEKNKKIEASSSAEKSKDYILKEAEMIISNYISNLENTNDKKYKNINSNKKYIRIKKYAYISSFIIFIQAITLLMK